MRFEGREFRGDPGCAPVECSEWLEIGRAGFRDGGGCALGKCSRWVEV